MATELGKAYVQIIPSAQGISGKLQSIINPEASSAGASGGQALGGKLVSAVKGLIAAAGIGKAFGAALKQGGELEQSIGGIETLFKGSSDKVRQYARESFKTVGVSANEYMQNVTSFSASLLQSLGGDTNKAADVANTAMVDMGDNANKMGTSMRDIQNAYQGFAKQNYTMLDNLKLGYGGTKGEMQRLLADATKLTGVKYDLSNLSDVYLAVHAIQENLGITGTTAKEASETLEGSFNSMKAAFTDLMGNIALGERVKESMQNLAQTISVFVFQNFIPMIGTILQSLPIAIATFFTTMVPILITEGGKLIQSLATGMTTGIPMVVQKMLELSQNLLTWVQQELPQMLNHGVQMITQFATGIGSGNGETLAKIGEIISNIFTAFMDAMPQIVIAGATILVKLAVGLLEKLPHLIETIGNILVRMIERLSQGSPEFNGKGIQLILELIKGIVDTIPKVVEAILKVIVALVTELVKSAPEFAKRGIEFLQQMYTGLYEAIPIVLEGIGALIAAIFDTLGPVAGRLAQKGVEFMRSIAEGISGAVNHVLNAISRAISDAVNSITSWGDHFYNAGFNLLVGLANGISGALGDVINSVQNSCSDIYNSVLGYFGIRSPSRLFAEIGGYLDAGLAKGIEGNLRPVNQAIETLKDAATMDDLRIGATVDPAIKRGVQDAAATSAQPAYITLSIGGKAFKAFVEDITAVQDAAVDLQMAY